MRNVVVQFVVVGLALCAVHQPLHAQHQGAQQQSTQKESELSDLRASSIQEFSVPLLAEDGSVIRAIPYTVQHFGNEQQHGVLLEGAGSSLAVLEQAGELLHGEVKDDQLILSEASEEFESGHCDQPFHSQAEAQHFEEMVEARGARLPQSLHSGVLGEEMREIELLAVVPSDFVAGRSEDAAVEDVLFAVEGANVFFRKLGLVIRLVGIQVFKDPGSDPYQYAAQIQNPYVMLDRLRAEWLFTESPARDATVLFSASTGLLSGLAFPAASCIAPEFSYGLVSRGAATGAQSRLRLASTLAHELGHIVGMSHDSTITALGVTIMWPTVSNSPAGFSEFSKSELINHQDKGGTSCFSAVQPRHFSGFTPAAVLPGATQEFIIEEGETISLHFVVPGQAFPTFIVAQGLPEGAFFDPSSGFFHFTPTASTVLAQERSKRFVFSLEALGVSGGRMEVGLTVLDSNQAPRLHFSTAEEFSVERGSPVSVLVQAVDLDANADTVRVEVLNQQSVMGYAGTPSLNLQGSSAQLQWTPSAVGDYSFLFVARDGAGAVSQRRLRIHVLEQNLAPEISYPRSFTVSSDKSSFVLAARDPEGAPVSLLTEGIPPGVLIERNGNSWNIDFSNAVFATEKRLLSIGVSDGERVSMAAIEVAMESKPLANAALWPGSGVPVVTATPYLGLFYYDGLRGIWEERSCSGALRESYQFGGLVGDWPLTFKDKGVMYPALYRIVGGSGVFYVRRKGIVEQTAWGLAGDIPVLADFDGDGVSDFAVYRPQTSSWHIKFSLLDPQNLYDMAAWGDAATPFAADVDGDGLEDRILIVRPPSSEVFADVRLANGKQYLMGIADVGILAGAEPLVSDIDQDGRADFVVRSSSGDLAGIRSNSAQVFSEPGYAKGARVVATSCGIGDANGLLTISRNPLFVVNEPGVVGTPSSLELLPAHQARQRSGAWRRPSVDVDGDRRSDRAVWRPKSASGIGYWFASLSASGEYRSPWLYSADSVPVPFAFESERGETLVTFEAGVWRLLSRLQGEREIIWGEPGDQALSGDYNGDGYNELIVFRPSNGSWWILFGPEFKAAIRVDFGAEGDVPLVADFDGDGADDLALFRPALGSWYLRFADGDVQTRVLGQVGDIPLPADYLGEGRAQLAVWRPSNGVWYIVRNDQEIVLRQWGLPGDVPFAHDSNGDGRTELLVWRPSEGGWYSRQIFDGLDVAGLVQYGLPFDLPLGPNWRNDRVLQVR